MNRAPQHLVSRVAPGYLRPPFPDCRPDTIADRIAAADKAGSVAAAPDVKPTSPPPASGAATLFAPVSQEPDREAAPASDCPLTETGAVLSSITPASASVGATARDEELGSPRADHFCYRPGEGVALVLTLAAGAAGLDRARLIDRAIVHYADSVVGLPALADFDAPDVIDIDFTDVPPLHARTAESRFIFGDRET